MVTRMVRGGALVDIQLESGEPAFLPLRSIPVKAMPVVRDLIDSGAIQQFRVEQVDRGQGTATLSVEGLISLPADPEPVRRPAPAPTPAAAPRAPVKPAKPTAGELARQRQQALLQRLRGEEA